MTDHKFTDDEIVKALEICTKSKCWGDCEDMGCPAATKHGCYFYLRTAEDYEGVVQDELLKDALALINRQKAEIERLKSENELLTENDVRNKYPNCVSVEKGRIYTCTLEDYDELIGDISAEAIKEFAECAKKRFSEKLGSVNESFFSYSVQREIDTLVKEMTEEQKNESQST